VSKRSLQPQLASDRAMAIATMTLTNVSIGYLLH
jgi:hypothetical protein